MRVLLIDDEQFYFQLIKNKLKEANYELEYAKSGSEGLAKIPSFEPELLIIDLKLPEMDGFEATLEIKKFSDTPIIALTAAAKLEIMERIDECEFEGFVAKPIDANELLKKVREVTAHGSYRA